MGRVGQSLETSSTVISLSLHLLGEYSRICRERGKVGPIVKDASYYIGRECHGSVQKTSSWWPLYPKYQGKPQAPELS